MGVRPQMHVIFGVDDFAGEEPFDGDMIIYSPDSETEEELAYVSDMIGDGGEKCISELIYWGGLYEGNKKLLGLIISSTDYDSDIVRALATVMPEFMSDGKLDIPVLDKDSHYVLARRAESCLPCADITFNWNWFYPSVLEHHRMYPVHAYVFRYFLSLIDIAIDPAKFKMMLVWYWT